MGKPRALAVVVVTLLLTQAGVALARTSSPPPAATSAVCGDLDRPETGIQGDVPLADQQSGRASEGYNCGLAVVAHEPLGGRGSNANMAWAGHCAYIAGDGIAVVDVSDPAAPRWVETLRTPGAEDAFETLHAVDAADRSLLVAGRYGLFFDFQFESSSPVDIYDVSDCAHPRHLSTVQFPRSVHNLTLTADGRTLWGTLPLQAFDLTDPSEPAFLGNLEEDLAAAGVNQLEYAHEAWPSADGARLTIGGQMPGEERSLIIDIEGWPANPPRLVAEMAGPGHSIRDATIGGRRYQLRSDESVVNPTAVGCLPSELTPVGGAAQAFLTDVHDETQPQPAGTLGLAINDPINCGSQVASGVNASSHYHDVDDPADTTFAMVSMWNAGLRVFDVRDPRAPREVAYFNPGQYDSPLGDPGAAPLDDGLNLMGARGLDQAWGHVRYVAETGHIWVTTRLGGFWVLELEPQVRAALGLPDRPAVHPLGTPPRTGSEPPLSAGLLDPAAPALYCTLGRL